MQNYRDKNIILEKFRGVFVKIQGPNYFMEFLIYFPTEKRVDRVYSGVDRAHRADARSMAR
jgi:hypothetical protein